MKFPGAAAWTRLALPALWPQLMPPCRICSKNRSRCGSALVFFAQYRAAGKIGSLQKISQGRDAPLEIAASRRGGWPACLPSPRRQWDKEHPGKIKFSLAPYAEEVRKIAAEKNVPLVDLQASSIALCESLGPEKCLEFSPTKTNSVGIAFIRLTFSK